MTTFIALMINTNLTIPAFMMTWDKFTHTKNISKPSRKRHQVKVRRHRRKVCYTFLKFGLVDQLRMMSAASVLRAGLSASPGPPLRCLTLYITGTSNITSPH